MNEIDELKDLVSRMRQGDAEARNILAERMYDRVVEISRYIRRTGSTRVQRWEQTEDLAHSAWFRIQRALECEDLQFESLTQLLRLAAQHIRFEIIDMYRKHQSRGTRHQTVQVNDDNSSTPELFVAVEPSSTDQEIAWAEFHEAVEKLPEEQKEVVELLWYQGIKQEAAAELTGVSIRQVKRRWRDAKLSLSTYLDPTLIG